MSTFPSFTSCGLPDIHAEWLGAYENSLEFATVPTILLPGRGPFQSTMASFFQEAGKSEK